MDPIRQLYLSVRALLLAILLSLFTGGTALAANSAKAGDHPAPRPAAAAVTADHPHDAHGEEAHGDATHVDADHGDDARHQDVHGHGHGGHGHGVTDFPMTDPDFAPMEAFVAAQRGKEELGVFEQLIFRARTTPLNVVATLIFFAAILHTFATPMLMKLAHEVQHRHEAQLEAQGVRIRGRRPVSLRATVLHFLGEVEAIFGIWVVPLLIVITLGKGWHTAETYMNTRIYTEPMFVVVIMAIASSRPVITFAESALGKVAQLGGGTASAWWLSLLVVAPILGSFITEPAAMTIAALLLAQRFYALNPSTNFKYATIGLLFVNISVGGTLTNFAAPPVLMVAGPDRWNWDFHFMLTHFGWRAVTGILISTGIYFAMFRKEFDQLNARAALAEHDFEAGDESIPDSAQPVPGWVIAVHMAFLGWTVLTAHSPALFVGGFLFFIAFTMGTAHHQESLKLKGPLLVGFFLAGLVTHGGLQGWWISPVLSALSEVPLFIGATLLTAFNDNAAITFLASQVGSFTPGIAEDAVLMRQLEYAVVAGAVTGGGLTVIANAPNPAGQSILARYFGGAVSPVGLLRGALLPTIIMAFAFILLPH